MEHDETWMRLAIEQCRRGLAAGQSPFGAVIVSGDELVAAGHNLVLASTDITAHGEITAIRRGCLARGSVDLTGCTIYSTCEPCPMCFSACHHANLDRIVFGATIADAAAAGFRQMRLDNVQMKALGGSRVEITPGVLRDENLELFRLWAADPTRRIYGGRVRD